jgi:hypothetical protein
MGYEWVLILTIFAYRYDGGAAVTAIPGFQTQADCMAAARAWLKQSKNEYASANALCAQRGRK